MSEKLHPTNWKCSNPDCKMTHSKSHWADHHQKMPGWKDKLTPHSTFDKESNPDFETVCEYCGHELIIKAREENEWPDYCPNCKQHRKNGDAKFCKVCGCPLEFEQQKRTWCPDCQKEREGIPAPLLCPHCGTTEERVVFVTAE